MPEASPPPPPPAPAPAPAPQFVANGLTGHIFVSEAGGAPPASARYGVSFYSTVTALGPTQVAGTQLGWGSWIIPDNRDFNQPLCPIGTTARDNWPERGPSYRDVYQTIEGGVGQWTSTRFPAAVPKFRINSTADCYSHEIASTGWDFYTQPLPAGSLGLAQLSNRLLVPPDGIVLDGSGTKALFGYGWLALPLIPAYTSPRGVPTGDQSWTLFVRAANFTGPVSFYTPTTWSDINAVDQTGLGRSADARPAYANGAAIEIGITPVFTSSDFAKVHYARIPRLAFGADGSGEGALLADIHYYGKEAIWDAVAAAWQSGTAPTGFNPGGSVPANLVNPGFGLHIDGTAVTLDGRFAAKVMGGGATFGLAWTGALESGVVPEYWVKGSNGWAPIAAASVPAETQLTTQTFPVAARGNVASLPTGAGSPWNAAAWAAGPFSVALPDGSMVNYVWYRFVDQPAIARLGLAAGVRAQLQAFVEAWHAAAGTAGITFAPPTSGTLVGINAAQLVTPPPGLEVGYVPIAIGQH